jgi:hypothetical protein
MYSDDMMVFDQTKQRYILTDKCAKAYNIDLERELNSTGVPNKSNLGDQILDRISRTVYNYVYSHGHREIKQYKITVRQRQMERKIREYETRAIMAKVVDPKEYVYADRKRAQWLQAYKDFSEANGRAWYRSRIKLI